MTTYRTKAELEAENKILRNGCRLEAVTKLARTAFIIVGLMYCFHVSGDVAKEWSGKNTTADINVNADLNASANINNQNHSSETEVVYKVPVYSWLVGLFGLIFGFSGISYGMAESKSRRDIIERFHPYQDAWERDKDENRTTSKLTKRGDTRPEDA